MPDRGSLEARSFPDLTVEQARVSYSGGYFVCFTCRVQMPNFPRTSEAQ